VTGGAFLSRREQFRSIESTNDVVRDWLTAGTPEVCLVVAAEQTAGRGRFDRTWVAPEGTALLLSLGFRPTYLAPDRLWRLSAAVALAMVDAAEDVAGLPLATLRLKWPNDIVVDRPDGLRKLAGLLARPGARHARGRWRWLGSAPTSTGPRIASVRAGWVDDQPARSLRPAGRGRVARGVLCCAWSRGSRLFARPEFDVAGWATARSAGRLVRLQGATEMRREAWRSAWTAPAGRDRVRSGRRAGARGAVRQVVGVRLAPAGV
jgi:hypothetical protein